MPDAPPFAEFIRALPQPDASLPPSMQAWLLGGEDALAMFYAIPDGATVPEHAHGAQWGVVLAGSFDLIVGGETRTYRAGDTYAVEAGVSHTAVLHPGYVGIDVFADADRYPKTPPTA
jgi:quercetin dioxygenase-like cupin family protein